jgi:hypothetical protein
LRLSLLLTPTADVEVVVVATAQNLVSVCAAFHCTRAYSCCLPNVHARASFPSS